MARTATESISRQLESVFEGSSVAGLSDRQLLDRFIASRDPAGEAAFAAIVARHGPMVLSICRQLVGDHHHVEDAFQAVFLVLARRAPSIRDPDLLGNWLYGVALRTARCAELQLDRRRKKEEGDMSRQGPGSSVATEPIAQPADQPIIERERAEALNREIDRLPKSFRLPVVLCYFEGLTLDEAARRLRCPAGTLRSRLARARDKLRRALTRRGVILPSAAIAAVLDSRAAIASVSLPQCDITARAAIQFAAGKPVSSAATALAQEVLRFIVVSKLKFAALAALPLAFGVTTAGFLARTPAIDDEPWIALATQQPPSAAKPDVAKQKPAPGRMFVVGRVLDPQGKPVPGAMVMVSARKKVGLGAAERERGVSSAIAHANANAFGQFQLESPRTSSTRNDEFMAVALAPGYGVGWTQIDPDAEQPAGDISLQPEQLIRGRLLDLTGRPAEGVAVSVTAIRRVLVENSSNYLSLVQRTEGPAYDSAAVNEIPAWPKPAKTDTEGRFSIHGVGRNVDVWLSIIDPRFALQRIELATDESPDEKVVSRTLQPAKIFTGRVTYADTGKPVPRARLDISARGAGQPGFREANFQTDADGHFRANPWPGDLFFVSANPPPGQLYLAISKRTDWPKGAIEQSLDLALPRGVVIRGMVSEEGSARPVAGASVFFRPHSRAAAEANHDGSESQTAADGSFELAAPPGEGHLAILASSEDYVLREIGNSEFFSGQTGGSRIFSNGFVACNPQPGAPNLDVRVALRRGATVAGRIIGPDQKPAEKTWIISPAVLGQSAPDWRLWHGSYHGIAINGQFELHGLNPDTDLPVYFLDPRRKLGATARLSGKSADALVTVRLEPCGAATVRLVDPKSRPVAGYRSDRMILMIVRPESNPVAANSLCAESDFLGRIDPINYANSPVSDAHGRISFPALIPGASYQIVRRTTGSQIPKNFTIKPGETLDLGDILIEKPQQQ
jgi:RNA polymerase sigma factor (sigma-70 family)